MDMIVYCSPFLAAYIVLFDTLIKLNRRMLSHVDPAQIFPVICPEYVVSSATGIYVQCLRGLFKLW